MNSFGIKNYGSDSWDHQTPERQGVKCLRGKVQNKLKLDTHKKKGVKLREK